ncbi:hypothetical protein LA303_11975 [Candidatus Sulfidibacterium hydrothermale]|uniref:hypothetical protein n=1 Tax=Candidatus Sulfidibacterium hydrothermale TaxID=2875962 RepID=UPI001F0A1D5F|nr:hypothetical protein [Candidatus Sulfidibacterium hydrothermale]UBM62104.1 hypothetical protein LA303_11975 [Candidatus Sulfidibacterium hydrothermale]
MPFENPPENSTPKTGLKRAIAFGRKYIDYRMGIYGAVVMASIVFYINFRGTQDYSGATTAALKQGTYTFFFGGFIMRLSERIAVEIRKKAIALILACVVPSLLSLVLTFGLHNLKGTPKPLQSTIPTAVFVIPATAVWGYLKRKKAEAKIHKTD